MKKMKLYALLLGAVAFASCSKDDVKADGPVIPSEAQVWKGASIGDGTAEFEIKGKYVIKKGVYDLRGWVYVVDGSELYIEPGTIIKGEKASKASLIIERGGKLFAEGTKTQPIVFTSAEAPGSRKPGDWGGLIVCGKAKNNLAEMTIEGGPRSKHGGSDDNDNSGIIRFVRVEFAGFPFATDQEINGITFGSVGRGTTIDHVQVSYSNDDSFEWFGGSVNAKYIVAYHGWDDDFDTDNGFSGNVQYALSVRNPRIADASVSNTFESDNNSSGNTAAPFTKAVFSNVTLVGPMVADAAFQNTSDYINGGSYNPNNGSRLGQYQAAVQIRRNSKLSIFNSVAAGFPVGLILDNEKGTAQAWAANGELSVDNFVFAGMTITGSDKNKSWNDYLSTDGKTEDNTQESFSTTYFKSKPGNTALASMGDLMLSQPNSLEAGVNFGPKAGSPLLNRDNLFTHGLLQDSFFDKVTYVGAFKSDSSADNWTLGWVNYDPQNTVY